MRDYNSIIHRVAAEHGAAVIPLYERLAAVLPPPSQVTPFDGSKKGGVLALVRHYILRHNWDRVSEMNGLTLLTDHVHLNDRATQVMADLVADFVGMA